MKLQKHKSRVVGDKTYYKYVIVIPQDLIDKLSWRDEQEIKGNVRNKKLVIEEV